MERLKTIASLLRVEQWYKNLVVFIALVFSGSLFDIGNLQLAMIAFMSLCLISSANYIINDLKDRKKDALHPLKKNRPIASGEVTISFAIVWTIGLLFVGMLLAYFLNHFFFLLLGFLFLLMQVYTFWLKRYAFIDILMISIFFVIRATLGALAILVWISPWLIVCPFFLALFLAANKRYSDIALHNEKLKNAVKTRRSLAKYNLKNSKFIFVGSGVLLVLSFLIYLILEHQLLLISMPFAIIALYEYVNLAIENPIVGLKTELALKNKRIIFSSILWLVLVLVVLYVF